MRIARTWRRSARPLGRQAALPWAVLPTVLLLLAPAAAAAQTGGQEGRPPSASANTPTAHYWVYVANEASDEVSRVRFGPEGLEVERNVEVGMLPADIDGAHGVTVSPDGLHWYVSVAHGTPFGEVWKYTTGSDRLAGKAKVGMFPATMAVTPDGQYLFVVNFNLHGNPVPSSVSAIFATGMQELSKIETCVKPHGSAINRAGSRHYSACVGSDLLVEISVEDLSVTRRLLLTPGREGLLDPTGPAVDEQESGSARCKPTWVVVTPDDRWLYVACNGNRELLEIDAGSLSVTRRFPTGIGPYNLAVSPDSRFLVATLKGQQAVAIVDRASGEERLVSTSRPVTHGVVISPDSRYAFVSNEAVSSTRGTLDVIDLRSGELVASAVLGLQPGGIAFWKMEALTSGS
ncbi:MAG: beta-propeller fold lactonase family protein [Gemmatimonadota bacterium]|nr:MAG: beta-propeller fold lactonase family protein [Gemmatimonadota bacterium]